MHFHQLVLVLVPMFLLLSVGGIVSLMLIYDAQSVIFQHIKN